MLNTTSKTFVMDIKIVQEMATNFKVEISYFLDDDFYVSIDITPIVSNQQPYQIKQHYSRGVF